MAISSIEQTVQQYTDTDIISQVVSGRTALFEILIRRYNPYLYKIGRSYGFNHHDTEDLMQESFVNAYMHLHQFEHRSSFKTWLVRIMVHQCYRISQKHSFRKEQPTEILPDNASFMFLPDNHSDNGQAVIGKEFNKMVEACLQKLPEDYRATFALRELAGLSVSETAELMRTSSANVKVRLNRAKAMLRKEIEKTYAPDDIYEFNLVYCDRIVNAVMKRIEAREENRH